jgi:hypothetical protein
MSRRVGIGFGVLAILGMVLWWLISKQGTEPAQEPTYVNERPALPENLPPGNRILEAYGSDSAKPEADLNAISHVLLNFSRLVKGPNPLPLGANEEITAALMGKNKVQLVFLKRPCKAVNELGQMIDRWGTPLFFHAEAKDRMEIRSAGPDQEMWTADDLHRQGDGQFRHGAALNSPSLFPSNRAPTQPTK